MKRGTFWENFAEFEYCGCIGGGAVLCCFTMVCGSGFSLLGRLCESCVRLVGFFEMGVFGIYRRDHDTGSENGTWMFIDSLF